MEINESQINESQINQTTNTDLTKINQTTNTDLTQIILNELKKEQELYVNDGETKYDDETFDAIKSWFEKETNEELSFIGANPRGDAMNLKFPMPSLDKITYGNKELKKLEKFMNENPPPYILSTKVDGTSLQLIYENGKLTICTGGNGMKGVDVSSIQEFVSFPQLNENIVIRGELTISTSDFEEIAPILREQGLKAKNSRGIVNGVVNRKEHNELVLSKCYFIAFGILSSDEKYSVQFKKLKRMGFITPKPVILNEIENEESLLEILLEEYEERSNSEYRMDGLVVVSEPNFHKVIENKNPEFAFAFKKNTTAVTEIISVTWNCTKYGYLAPVAIIKPVEILGTEMRQSFVENAREVVEKGIGPGAIVVVTFCGDIRPKIVEVIKKVEPQLPDIDCHWNETKVKLIVDRPEDFPIIRILKMEHFVKTLEIKDCKEKRIEKMFNHGIDSIEKLLRVRAEDLKEIGMHKSGENFVSNMKEALKNATWPKIMAASGIFPELVGIQRCELFVENFPDWRYETITKEQILQIDGFGEILSERMADSLPRFKEWISRNSMCQPKKIQIKKREQNLLNEIIVFTGVTASGILKEEIISRGGIVKDNWVKTATILVAKNVNSQSGKMREARNAGCKIISLDEFLNYLK